RPWAGRKETVMAFRTPFTSELSECSEVVSNSPPLCLRRFLQLPAEIFLDRALLPVGVQERDLVEHPEAMQRQRQGPGNRGPLHPEMAWRGEDVDHDEEADDQDVLDEVDVEALDLAHAGERQ